MIEKSAKADAPDYVIIKSGYEQYKLQLQEILFLESAGNYISFVTKENKKILSRMSMQEALALLPVNRFTRVHRSFIVSNDKVTKADRNNLYMGNISIPIGAAYAEAVNLTLR
jgi:DNA-binding LytR/AlgR family response regulator